MFSTSVMSIWRCGDKINSTIHNSNSKKEWNKWIHSENTQDKILNKNNFNEKPEKEE